MKGHDSHGWMRRVRRTGCLALLALIAAGEAAAQASGDAPAEPEAREARKKRRGWEPQWELSLGSEYDGNTFKLRPGQVTRLENGDARYASMESPQDIVHTVRIGGELRGPRVGSSRTSIGGDIRLDAYTQNRRRSNLSLEAFASRELSKRDAVELSFSLTPSEFRRNYLIGSDASGGPRYAAGVANTTEGQLEYERELLRGKRGQPELKTSVALLAGRRSYADFPWRNRTELGGELEADLVLRKRLGLELSLARVRASHDVEPEPVLDAGGNVAMQTLNRDFDQTELETEASLRMGRRRLTLSYGWRARAYEAGLDEDPVYGDRRDRRSRYGAELDLVARRSIRLSLGGVHYNQTVFQPGRGDTGDEADYSRSTVFLRMGISR